jgi:hypothetical protein
MKPPRIHITLAAVTLLLTLASAIVMLKGASDEPYFSFRASDALVQIGVAMVLMLLWLQLAVFLVWAVAVQRASKLWLLLLLWIVLCECVLSDSPRGYVQDILKFARLPR